MSYLTCCLVILSEEETRKQRGNLIQHHVTQSKEAKQGASVNSSSATAFSPHTIIVKNRLPERSITCISLLQSMVESQQDSQALINFFFCMPTYRIGS